MSLISRYRRRAHELLACRKTYQHRDIHYRHGLKRFCLPLSDFITRRPESPSSRISFHLLTSLHRPAEAAVPRILPGLRAPALDLYFRIHRAPHFSPPRSFHQRSYEISFVERHTAAEPA